MIPRHWIAPAILVLGALLPASAMAERRLSSVPPGATIHRVGVPYTIAAACTLGSMRTPDLLLEVFPGDDFYFTRLDRSVCAPCTTAVLSTAYVTMDFPVACSIPIDIYVFKSTGGACPAPDVYSLIPTIYGPYPTELSAFDVGINEFAIALPPAWQISEDAFLAISFPRAAKHCSAPGEIPQIALHPFCPGCRFYQGFGGDVYDLCASPSTGSPIMSVDVESCSTTPTRAKSWGSVKARYH